MKKYLRILAFFYLLGGMLHVLDLFDLRLKFSEMTTFWKVWICYLGTMDFVVAWGLWKFKKWGIFFFILVALSQLIAYIGFKDYFGAQYSLIIFHLITLTMFNFFQLREGKKV